MRWFGFVSFYFSSCSFLLFSLNASIELSEMPKFKLSSLFSFWSVLSKFIINAESRIYRAFDADLERFYATSTTIIGNRYVSIPADLRVIRYVQLKDDDGNQTYLEQRDPSFMAEYYTTPGYSSTNIPKYYGNWDEEYWVIAPTPDTAY